MTDEDLDGIVEMRTDGALERIEAKLDEQNERLAEMDAFHKVRLTQITNQLDELLALLRPKPVTPEEMVAIGELPVVVGRGIGALAAKVSDLKGWPWQQNISAPQEMEVLANQCPRAVAGHRADAARPRLERWRR